jgi:hypothetical protein
VTTLVVAFAVAAAGCTDDRDTTSTAPEFTNGSAGCDFSAVLSNAKSLFGHYSAGYQLAVQLSEQTPKSAAATNLGFDILAAIAGLRDASGLTDAQTTKAARLTVQVIRCAQVKATGVKTAAAFTKALGPTGAFQVRGGTSTAGVPDPSTSVLALDKQAGIQAPADDFAGWLGGRALFYGYPVTPFPGELTGAAAGLGGRVSFDWSLVIGSAVTLPRPTKGKFSLCVTAEEEVSELLRVQKIAQILEIAAPVEGLECLAEEVASAGSLTLGERLAALGTRLLAPAPLHAAALARRTSTPTGSAGSFSPFQVGNPVSVGLTYASRPRNGRQNQPVPGTTLPAVTVKAAGAGGTPWEGVLVRIIGFRNNGTPTEVLNNEAVTDAAGLASFPGLTVTKTGAIRLVAFTVSGDADVEGFATSSVEAPKVNIRP